MNCAPAVCACADDECAKVWAGIAANHIGRQCRVGGVAASEFKQFPQRGVFGFEFLEAYVVRGEPVNLGLKPPIFTAQFARFVERAEKIAGAARQAGE